MPQSLLAYLATKSSTQTLDKIKDSLTKIVVADRKLSFFLTYAASKSYFQLVSSMFYKGRVN